MNSIFVSLDKPCDSDLCDINIRWESNVLAKFCLWPMVGNLQSLFSRTNQMANKQRRQKKHVKIFLNFTYLGKTQPGQKTAGNSRVFFSLGIQVQMPVKIPHALMEIPIDESHRIFSMLVYATSSQVIKPLDKTSFQFHNLFHTMKTCAMNTKSSILAITIVKECCNWSSKSLSSAMFSTPFVVPQFHGP